MGVLKLFEGTGDLFCAIATIKTSEGVIQKVVDGTAFSVGRAPDCVLSIPDVGISRLHMLVTIKRGEIYITDQGSSNGTYLNGEKIEAKRLIHIKATDEIKLGKSEVIIQFGVVEKHFKTDYIAESLLPQTEKDNLLGLIKASHHKAQEIVGMAQSQADQLVQFSTEKARNIENQTLLMQEDILSKAQVESQGIVAETKRKSAQMIFEAEEKAREATRSIHAEADQKRFEAEEYYKGKVREAQAKGDEIIAQHTKMGQELIEDLRQKTIEKAEREAKEQLSSLFKVIDEKSEELHKLEADINAYQTTKRGEIDAELEQTKKEFYKKFEFERQTTLDDHHSRVAMLEAEFLHKKQELDEEESQRIQEIDSRVRALNERLDKEYAEKRVRLEKEYVDKSVFVEKDFSAKKSQLEEEFQRRQTELNANYERSRTELDSTIDKQRRLLEKEVESQRQNLLKVQSELESYSEEHLNLKAEVEELTQTVKGLQKSEQDIINSVQQKRTELESIISEQARLTSEISEYDMKIKDLQALHKNLKANFDDDSQKYQKVHEANALKHQSAIDELKKKYEEDLNKYQADHESNRKKHEGEIENLKARYEAESLKLKNEYEKEIQKNRAEIIKKTQDYQELEQIKLEEYRSQILNEKKQMDMKFESTKKEFELKTREMIEFEKKKLEEQKQQFLAILNQQRAVVINELTKAVIKIEKRGDATHSTQLIAQAVENVFDSHVAELSVTTHTTSAPASANKVKAQWLSYGVGITMALVIGFKILIQPQINRYVAGTEENTAAAAVSKERPKFQRSTSLELKESYVDSIVSTQRYAEIYMDEELHDKWFKYISSYMFENWRVPEEKTIEAVAIAKSLVGSLEQTAASLDQEFATQGIEKMRVSEQEAVKRMSDILGTQVKYEAFKRKEKEFFEPYIMNQ